MKRYAVAEQENDRTIVSDNETGEVYYARILCQVERLHNPGCTIGYTVVTGVSINPFGSNAVLINGMWYRYDHKHTIYSRKMH